VLPKEKKIKQKKSTWGEGAKKSFIVRKLFFSNVTKIKFAINFFPFYFFLYTLSTPVSRSILSRLRAVGIAFFFRKNKINCKNLSTMAIKIGKLSHNTFFESLLFVSV
jgi:hypothetical protein